MGIYDGTDAVSTGVCVGGRVRVAAERRRQPGAIHAVRSASDQAECGHQQDSVTQAVRDQRRETHSVHRHDAVHGAMYAVQLNHYGRRSTIPPPTRV